MSTENICVMARLKSATADVHRTAESRELQAAMLDGTLPRELFGEYLEQMLLIHRALETVLTSARHGVSHHNGILHVFRDYHRREENLRTDLEFFGVDTNAIPPAPATLELMQRIEELATTNAIALLGMLYVLEGSMNGNIFVARSIGRAYGLTGTAGLSYLNPYGDHATQKARWQQFKDDMNALELSEADIEAILTAAMDMFRSIITLSDELMEPVLV